MEETVFAPSARLAPFVRRFTVLEARDEATRTLLPDSGVILGFRYGGSATQVEGPGPRRLPNNTLTGLRATAREMRTSAGGGAVLVTFHEVGAAQVFADPLHTLFGTTCSLDDLMPRVDVDRVSSQVAAGASHAQRIATIEQFLLARWRPDETDLIVSAAVRSIHAAHGSVRIAALAREFHIGQDALEKRFRRMVGASPKQFASIVRLRHAISLYRPGTSLSELSIDAGYFDQSHFNREFRAVIGQSPQQFFRADAYC